MSLSVKLGLRKNLSFNFISVNKKGVNSIKYEYENINKFKVKFFLSKSIIRHQNI